MEKHIAIANDKKHIIAKTKINLEDPGEIRIEHVWRKKRNAISKVFDDENNQMMCVSEVRKENLDNLLLDMRLKSIICRKKKKDRNSQNQV